jgi:hypothetical protein
MEDMTKLTVEELFKTVFEEETNSDRYQASMNELVMVRGVTLSKYTDWLHNKQI